MFVCLGVANRVGVLSCCAECSGMMQQGSFNSRKPVKKYEAEFDKKGLILKVHM